MTWLYLLALPFSRDQRRWVYASAKAENSYFGFGTDNDIEGSSNCLIIKHTTLGGAAAPSAAAVEAINRGCALADCLHDTGDGGIGCASASRRARCGRSRSSSARAPSRASALCSPRPRSGARSPRRAASRPDATA